MSFLYPHNQIAYDAALRMLDADGKACVIHPTGTGKSFIGFQLAADFPFDRVLWLAPSQYIFDTQLENWHKAGGPDLPNVTFLTYARLMLLPPDEFHALTHGASKPGIVVLDEFHRAGAEQWGLGVRRLLDAVPDARLLGLTATNIRYLDAQRDMAQELFDGHVASEMSLGEAIVRGILPAPKYVLSIFKYKDDLVKYELRARHAKSRATRDAAEEIIEKLRRALENAVGMDELFARHMTDRAGKYLVFCANAEHMAEMMAHVPEWFAKVDPHPHVYSAYSDDPGTSRAFADFKADASDHLKLLFCIDMLNEGIHVDDVSGVILLRPTVSPIVYKQQIGRALSARRCVNGDCPPDTCLGETVSGRTVPLTHRAAVTPPVRPLTPTAPPIIFDIVLNIENLYSISSLQEEMEVAMTYYRSLGRDGDIVTDSFEVVDEVHDCLELFDRLNETLTASWDIMYDVARAYWQENGDLDVPVRFVTREGYSLGQWISIQRRVRKGTVRGLLTPERIRLLDAIGMRWESALDQSWERYYAAARKYREEYGDLRVPYQYVTEDGLQLANWISGLRGYRKNGARSAYLTDERIAALDALGMQWDVLDYLFERNYAAAVEYHRTHGDLDVPHDYVDPNGICLGHWLRRLCRIRAGKSQRGRLTDEQIARLDQLGMIWGNRNDLAWEKGYAYAEAYYAEHHDLTPAPSYRTPDGYKLGNWVSDQREKWRAGKMKPGRKQRLDALHMLWELPDPWEVRFALAVRYREEHGDLRVPSDYVMDGIWLGRWISEQRAIFCGRRPGRSLTADQADRLTELGMKWT